MPANAASQELKCRLFSLYLRPWVLDDAHSSAKVPHLKQLIRVPEADTGQQTGIIVGIASFPHTRYVKMLHVDNASIEFQNWSLEKYQQISMI